MQIIINITEDAYNRIKSNGAIIPYYELTDAIKQGTIFPKGHGRLIDADVFTKKVCTYQQTGCGDCKHSLCCPEDEPTIIEADKEGK